VSHLRGAVQTCNEIIETQLKFLVNSADPICIELDAGTHDGQVADDTILWTIEVRQKQLGPLMHNSPPKFTTVRIHMLVPGPGEFNLEKFSDVK
jgi:hypothetical protein